MRRRTALLLSVLSLLALAAIRAGGGGPPLYDGICLPVSYLSLGGNPAPTSVTKVITIGQQFPTSVVATTESAPQAQVIFEAGTFTVSPGAAVTVTITPVPPPAVKPSDGSITGNVYDISAAGPGGGALQPVAGKPATIALEAPAAGGPQPVLEAFGGNRWTDLATLQSGCATTEEATSQTLGLFALVVQGASSSSGGPGTGSSAGGGAGVAPLLVGGAVVFVLAVLVGVLRVNRRSRR